MKHLIALILLFLICFGSTLGFMHLTDKADEKGPQNYRFLVCITSYKRPIFLSGQILRFQNQTYKNFHISVALKGISQESASSTFMQEWQPMIDKGLLSIRFYPNKTQLSNFLDTVRHMDLTQYDYFCKVDDDDWYTPDYLQSINDFLNQGKNIILTQTTNTFVLKNKNKNDDTNKNVWMYPYRGELTGPTMCLSRPLVRKLLRIEQYPSAAEPEISRKQVTRLKLLNEDKLFNVVAETMGQVQYRREGQQKVIYGRQYPSLTRGVGE